MLRSSRRTTNPINDTNTSPTILSPFFPIPKSNTTSSTTMVQSDTGSHSPPTTSNNTPNFTSTIDDYDTLKPLERQQILESIKQSSNPSMYYNPSSTSSSSIFDNTLVKYLLYITIILVLFSLLLLSLYIVLYILFSIFTSLCFIYSEINHYFTSHLVSSHSHTNTVDL